MTIPGMAVARHIIARPRLDPSLTVALGLLIGFGLVILYSATNQSSDMVVRQVIRIGAGLAAMLVLSRLPPKFLQRWTPVLYAISVLLLVAVAITGEGRGAQRWLDLGVVRFQPSELLKLTVPMMLAWYLHRVLLPPRWIDVAVCAGLMAVPVLLIARQPDLGTSLLVAVSGSFVMFLSGLRWRVMLLFAAIGAAASPLLWQNMHAYQRDRVLTMFNPEADPLGRGWNIIQSKIAVGSGGATGKGYGQGTQAHLDFLPESQTDFILAVVGEEFGFVGVIGLFALYFYIIMRCLAIAANGRDSYSRLLAGALALTFFIYVLVNAGMISGVLPVVGVPLPLISYGGTSLVSLLAAFGIIMAVHNHRRLVRK